MYASLMTDASLYETLEMIDVDLAATAREAGCWCGGVLHSANYTRKPRGGPVGPVGLGAGYDLRWSFCCALDGCRSRTTPPSVRFLGRKVYLGAVVVVANILRHGVTRWRAERLRALLGVSERTLRRWHTFWKRTFAQSTFWKQAKAHLAQPVAASELPGGLLDCFAGNAATKLERLLYFLRPITTESMGIGRQK